MGKIDDLINMCKERYTKENSKPPTFEIVDGEFKIQMKWDGCCNIVRCYESIEYEQENFDYIHICELKEFIDLLNKVLEKAKELDYEV